MKGNEIIVYVDRGVMGPSLKRLFKSLEEEVDTRRHTIRRMDAGSLKTQAWERDAALLIIPGGRDSYYHADLEKEGAEKIKEFVAEGGSYLGLCGGAYYAAQAIEFEKGGPLEICGERPLKFYPGIARGPAYGLNKYCYNSEKGAEAALISWEKGDALSYFNGGCYFSSSEAYPEIEILGRYADLDEKPAAIVSCPYEKGRAILSGVHLEFKVEQTDSDSKIHRLLKEKDVERRSLFRHVLERCFLKLN